MHARGLILISSEFFSSIEVLHLERRVIGLFPAPPPAMVLSPRPSMRDAGHRIFAGISGSSHPSCKAIDRCMVGGICGCRVIDERLYLNRYLRSKVGSSLETRQLDRRSAIAVSSKWSCAYTHRHLGSHSPRSRAYGLIQYPVDAVVLCLSARELSGM